MSFYESRGNLPSTVVGKVVLPRILILEDDERVRSELVLCLSEEGFDCLACRTAEQAIRLSQVHNDIAVGIIDIRLPGQSGLDFIAAVRDRDATYMPMRFIVMSGYVDLNSAMQGLRLKIDDLLRKPVDPDVLIEAVKRSLLNVSVELLGRGVAAALAEDADDRPSRAEALVPRIDRHTQLIENFIGLLTQELRSPLVSIIDYAHGLISGSSEPTATREAGEHIRFEAVKLLERIDSILDLSRLTTGVAWPRPAAVNPIALMEMVRRNFADAAPARSVRIDVHVLEAPAEAVIDRAMWVQTVAHVLRNAVEHASPKTTVKVRLDAAEGQLLCTVQNAGVPISTSVLERATEPFRQGSEGQARQKRGLGLGLALARRYIELHGGALRIDGIGPGGVPGTTVVLTLPLSVARPLFPSDDAGRHTTDSVDLG